MLAKRIRQSTKQLVGLCPGDVPRFGCQAENSLQSTLTANFEPELQLAQCPLIDLQLLVANGKLIAPHCFMLSFTFLLIWEKAFAEAMVVASLVNSPFCRSGRKDVVLGRGDAREWLLYSEKGGIRWSAHWLVVGVISAQ